MHNNALRSTHSGTRCVSSDTFFPRMPITNMIGTGRWFQILVSITAAWHQLVTSITRAITGTRKHIFRHQSTTITTCLTSPVDPNNTSTQYIGWLVDVKPICRASQIYAGVFATMPPCRRRSDDCNHLVHRLASQVPIL